MHKVVPLAEINNLLPVSQDINFALRLTENQDIAEEFPSTVERYGGDPIVAYFNMCEAKEDCSPGLRERFVVFTGRKAVGMSIVSILPETEVPANIEPHWPNLSGFISAPYRGYGLGSLSLNTRLKTVDRNFGGHAWTKVKRQNIISQRMVESAGLSLHSADDEHYIYTYQSQ